MEGLLAPGPALPLEMRWFTIGQIQDKGGELKQEEDRSKGTGEEAPRQTSRAEQEVQGLRCQALKFGQALGFL